MAHLANFAAGTAVGAVVAYYADPVRGRRRRSLLRDRVLHAYRRFGNFLDAALRDLTHRSQGIVAEVRNKLASEEVTDDVLVQRARSRLGRVVSHPSAIEVKAHQGTLVISGPVLAHEVNHLLRGMRSLRGVRQLEQRLDVYKEPGNIAALQGGSGHRQPRFELMQSNWSPGTRLLAGLAGTVAMAQCAARPTPLRLLIGTAGFALFVRAAVNRELATALGLTGGHGVTVERTLNIRAPLEEVFEHFRRCENFPNSMVHIREVRSLGNGRWHWVVAGPAGATVPFDARLTDFVPQQRIAWTTEPGSAVTHAGVLRFDRNPDDTTRLHIQLTYQPPAGALGHAVASLLGADPKSELDADLMRLKTMLETKTAPAH